ncbi:VOC family protein [Cellulomonas sp. RIT-PI-Y]|jgi:catechol 2,3-dioxygenase-like lactoylglutathione lyase family enzyme|uniref:VOC family protein n=1 Tax=Cellulomonas sp. RIT-PI-Y TaxID=3035297 RepID=UPI0021D87C7A|nr:VOC family protein [Cellulomonas sp. RIT-PI-Y]
MADLGNPFSGYSVDDIDAAQRFYGQTLGLETRPVNGLLWLRLGTGADVLLYPKGDAHVPASFTVLNFRVADVPGTVAELRGRGVEFERYEGTPTQTDEDGVFRGGGPLIAWFTDPAGNVLSIVADD